MLSAVPLVSCTKMPVSRYQRNICRAVLPVPRMSAAESNAITFPRTLAVGFELSPAKCVIWFRVRESFPAGLSE